ncbi:MAG: hypothetical protein AB1Z98_16775 [Nannocystaceae bacterium]
MFADERSTTDELGRADEARPFALDVLECPECRGPMKIIAAIREPKVIRSFLAALDLPTEIPKVERSRPPPQLELDWDDDPR